MDDKGAAQSRTEHVFESLRFDLLESRIQPGERLKLVELAEGVTREQVQAKTGVPLI